MTGESRPTGSADHGRVPIIAFRVEDHKARPHGRTAGQITVYARDPQGLDVLWELRIAEDGPGPGLRVHAPATALASIAQVPGLMAALSGGTATLSGVRAALAALGASDESPRAAALVVTLPEIAGMCNVTDEAAGSWRAMPGFPAPLPGGDDTAGWWWPDVRDFIAASAADMSGDVPLLAEALPPPPRGKRGPVPVNWIRTGFDLRLLAFMAAQADQVGRPRYTRAQIASSLLHPVPYHVVSQYLPRRGPGGDPRELPPAAIARIRVLRAEKGPDGRHAHTLKQIADMFEVSQMTIVRHCVDLSFPDAAGSGGMHHAEASGPGGAPLSRARARAAGAMYARRAPDGNRVHTLDQVAAKFGVSVPEIRRALRIGRSGRIPGQHSAERQQRSR